MSPPRGAKPAESFEGQIIGDKYLVGELVGTGGMGTVWAGRHVHLGTRVAIKFIRPQFVEREEARRRFEIEARAAANVKSVHAVQVLEYGLTEAGLPYIVMEFLEGESLAETLQRAGPIAPPEVAKIVGQAAKALSKAHRAGIVHRDLKPDNFFLATNVETADNELPYSVKLVDFGIAKMLDVGLDSEDFAISGPTLNGLVIGTPNFMSPEQLTLGGDPDPLTDLWSLGATVFAAMTGKIPFPGTVLGDIVIKVCKDPLPVPSALKDSLPPGFDAWFARACSRDRAERFQTVEELASSLARVCGTAPALRVTTLADDRVRHEWKPQAGTEGLEALIPQPPAGGLSPRVALLTGIIVGVALMVGLLGFLAWQDSAARSEPVPGDQSAP